MIGIQVNNIAGKNQYLLKGFGSSKVTLRSTIVVPSSSRCQFCSFFSLCNCRLPLMNGRKKIKQSTVIQVMNMAYTMESYLVKSEVKGRIARTIAILRMLILALDIISITFGFPNSSDGKVTPKNNILVWF